MTGSNTWGDGEPTSSYDGFAYGRELSPEPDGATYDGATYDESGSGDGGYQLYYEDDERFDQEEKEADADAAAQAVVSRRRFLAGLALGGTAGLTGYWALTRGDEVTSVAPGSQPSTTPAGLVSARPSVPDAIVPVDTAASNLLTPAPVGERVLVLIELEGGNDGPSTVVPYGSGAYYDARPKLAIPADQVLVIDDEIGLNPNLARLHARQHAIVEGVGPVDGSLSHFEMVARWEQGDLHGNRGLRTGFLARLADQLDDGSATIGLSVKGFTPRFNNATASTLSLNNLRQLRVLTKDDWIFPSYRQALTSFQGGPLTTMMAGSWQHLVTIGSALPNEMEEIDEESSIVSEGGDLGRQLATAAQVIRADLGVRVIHARISGFDTHEGHQWKHEGLMKKFDAAVDGFLAKLDESDLANRVLVATSSEFGRRVEQNGNGLDHGAGSSMLLFGPVQPGRFGQAPSLSDLDARGNLKTTVTFDSYLGTLAEQWLGVPAASVLPTSPELLDVIAA